jgi:hypothetical protein
MWSRKLLHKKPFRALKAQYMTSRRADDIDRFAGALARAHGYAAYAHFRDRYRDMTTSLGFEGHMAWAEAMP